MQYTLRSLRRERHATEIFERRGLEIFAFWGGIFKATNENCAKIYVILIVARSYRLIHQLHCLCQAFSFSVAPVSARHGTLGFFCSQVRTLRQDQPQSCRTKTYL